MNSYHESELAPGDSEGQGGSACSGPRSRTAGRDLATDSNEQVSSWFQELKMVFYHLKLILFCVTDSEAIFDQQKLNQPRRQIP